MAIQLSAMELLRDLERETIPSTDDDVFGKILEDRFRALLPKLADVGLAKRYGLSGAQAAAAMNIAWIFHKDGYAPALAKVEDRERLIKLVKTPFTE